MTGYRNDSNFLVAGNWNSFLTSLAFQFGERLSFLKQNNVEMLSKTENDHDPEITGLAHEEGAEGAKDEYEKDLQYNG